MILNNATETLAMQLAESISLALRNVEVRLDFAASGSMSEVVLSLSMDVLQEGEVTAVKREHVIPPSILFQGDTSIRILSKSICDSFRAAVMDKVFGQEEEPAFELSIAEDLLASTPCTKRDPRKMYSTLGDLIKDM